MSTRDKNKDTPATNTADANAPKREKARAGSSVGAQAKTLIVGLFNEISEHLKANFENTGLTDLMSEHTAEWFTTLAGELSSNTLRGLPLSTRIANVEAEIAAHWPTLIVNGKPMTPADSAYAAWEAKSQALLTKKNNLLRAQKRESNPAPANTSTASA